MRWTLVGFGRKDLHGRVGMEVWGQLQSVPYLYWAPSVTLLQWPSCHQAVLLSKGHFRESLCHQQWLECLFFWCCTSLKAVGETVDMCVMTMCDVSLTRSLCIHRDGEKLPIAWWDTVTKLWGQTGLGSHLWGSNGQQDPLGTDRVPVSRTAVAFDGIPGGGCPVQGYPSFVCASLRHGSLLAKSDTRCGLRMRQVHCHPFCTYQIASRFTQQTGGASYPLSCHARGWQGPAWSLGPSLWPHFCPYYHLFPEWARWSRLGYWWDRIYTAELELAGGEPHVNQWGFFPPRCIFVFGGKKVLGKLWHC